MWMGIVIVVDMLLVLDAPHTITRTVIATTLAYLALRSAEESAAGPIGLWDALFAHPPRPLVRKRCH
eukprot:gene55830-52867_t